eukprot:CAMPEP_0184383288 /NCGR_PEP_ID=MMETSP0007-20130409/7015_1 /TAXON_ID=97485 /ORGANISM="Prymnesium parvum, Strain Texoma1" /LENGTH=43 /DNA_ID= /DNA_START= /DNA_END= /DNA_ORIENTATION=
MTNGSNMHELASSSVASQLACCLGSGGGSELCSIVPSSTGGDI